MLYINCSRTENSWQPKPSLLISLAELSFVSAELTRHSVRHGLHGSLSSFRQGCQAPGYQGISILELQMICSYTHIFIYFSFSWFNLPKGDFFFFVWNWKIFMNGFFACWMLLFFFRFLVPDLSLFYLRFVIVFVGWRKSMPKFLILISLIPCIFASIWMDGWSIRCLKSEYFIFMHVCRFDWLGVVELLLKYSYRKSTCRIHLNFGSWNHW